MRELAPITLSHLVGDSNCDALFFFFLRRIVSFLSNAIFSLLQSLVLKSVLKKGGQSELFFLTAEKNPPRISNGNILRFLFQAR